MPRRQRSGRIRIKDVIAQRLADIAPTANAIERLACKIETVVDAFVEAEEIPIRLRRRADAGHGTTPLENILDRVIGSMEAVIEIPFAEEEGDDENATD